MPAKTNGVPNRLIHESSPYLLQHAHNPVDWFPWGNEAFEKAKSEDKPVFLSIGYSTCHWCHVMAHESFENEEIASLLGDSFVSVKVDREERPDIDEVYMSVCQAMTGSGGWPLSIFMTPDKKPFFAGTYFPPASVYGRVGLSELLEKISALWKTDREALVKQSEKISGMFTKAQTKGTAADAAKLVETGYRSLQRMYDGVNGGFSHAPKFPVPHYLDFLMMVHRAHQNKEALGMAEFTLAQMYRGGIFDQAGFGFSRYSTDERWLVPHFEKMLYDNALLLKAYAQCYAVGKNGLYREAADKIRAYLVREMISPEGVFYSAQDADSEGEEGKFYVWSYGELQNALAPDELSILETQYGVSRDGNFEGRNILHRTGGAQENPAAAAVLRKLFKLREKRVPPFKDTKISASWNGLAIEAFAAAGMLLGDAGYIEIARKAAGFIIERMTGEDGAVSGIYGKPGGGFLADYANVACAMRRLYDATMEIRYLRCALLIADRMIARFYESGENRFYMTGREDAELFMRPRDEYDGAMPSGTAAAMMALARLYRMTGKQQYKRVLDAAAKAFSAEAKESPASHVHFLSVLLSLSTPHRQIIIAAAKDDAEAIDTVHRINSQYAPFSTAIRYDQSAEMDALFPELARYKTDRPFAAYVCENFACDQPIFSAAELRERYSL
jgi:Highly conserved protein containing a thioredoxin domain